MKHRGIDNEYIRVIGVIDLWMTRFRLEKI